MFDQKRHDAGVWVVYDADRIIALRGAIVGHGVIDVPKQIELMKKSRLQRISLAGNLRAWKIRSRQCDWGRSTCGRWFEG